MVAEAISAGIFNDLGSGSNVDVCIITKDNTEMLRNFEMPVSFVPLRAFCSFYETTTRRIESTEPDRSPPSRSFLSLTEPTSNEGFVVQVPSRNDGVEEGGREAVRGFFVDKGSHRWRPGRCGSSCGSSGRGSDGGRCWSVVYSFLVDELTRRGGCWIDVSFEPSRRGRRARDRKREQRQ